MGQQLMNHNFDRLPTVDWLASLAPGLLWQKGNLAKAVRLWVMLRSLYGDLSVNIPTDDEGWFSNAQWREAFIKPKIRTKTIQQWLFEEQPAIDPQQWRQSFLKRYGIERDRLSLMLGDALKTERKRAQTVGSEAYPLYPFEVDDRTFRNDFATLEKLGWLQSIGVASQRRYHKVDVLPDTSDEAASSELPAALELTTTHFIPNDLAVVVDHFPQPINGVQRFILDVEYIVPESVTRQVDRLLQDLKQLWQQTPVPPVRLTYRSIRYYETEFELITYPVCIYYFQRAPYLFAFGQTPQSMESDRPDIPNWYDYRLDRILALQPLTWQESHLPATWWERARSSKSASSRTIPRLFAEKTPALVEQEVDSALGVEIHRPSVPLLLRFERYFYGNYIANTERAKRFQEMGFEKAEKYFQADPEVQQQGLSLHYLFHDRPRHKNSIFSLAQHRLKDNNVVMRLRAWGPNVEVLLPLSLRQRMSDDMQETWKLYGENRHD